MARHLLIIHLMTLSLLLGDGMVQIELTNGQEVQGEFIGTYMDHVHVLTGEKLYYYPVMPSNPSHLHREKHLTTTAVRAP